VGRLLVVLVAVAGARRGDVRGVIHGQAPAAQGDEGDAGVPQVALSPVPEPVPGIGEVIGPERPPRRRALPQVVVQPLGHRSLAAAAGGWAVVLVPALRQVGPADGAAADALHGLDDLGPAAPLVAHLDVLAVLAGGGHEQLAL